MKLSDILSKFYAYTLIYFLNSLLMNQIIYLNFLDLNNSFIHYYVD